MAAVVGILFQKNGKINKYDANNLELKKEEYVIVETSHGIELGQVAVEYQPDEDNSETPLKKVIRVANEKDLQTSAENRKKEREAFIICQKKIAEHNLEMKLVSVEYAFDGSKALFYFTANGRVDFRSLVKDLASIFKMRIELRQIGVRDEARMLGGLGPCGRPICCGAFLDEFQPVSIKMAKEQNLSLNPTKISGVCGRLMCCLKYEQDQYEQTRKIMPRVGKEVNTPDGAGVVSDLNIVKETVFVRITNGDSSEIKEFPLDQIEKAAPVARANITEQNSTENTEAEVRTKAAEKNTNASERPPRQEKNTRRSGSNRSGNSQKVEKINDTKTNAALGKPVLRENPNRNNLRKNETEKKAVSSNWADAVRKAIDSINE